MSRTAVEIKSSVGAQAVDTYCYLFSGNKIYNKLVPSLVKRLAKAEEWQTKAFLNKKKNINIFVTNLIEDAFVFL